MNKLAFRFTFLSITFLPLLSYAQVNGQTYIGQDSTNRTIVTALPFLTISPDSRSAALGDAGVASSPDANAAYWNAGKLGFYRQIVWRFDVLYPLAWQSGE